MDMMIVPIPYFDSDMTVKAYWLDYRDGSKMLGVKDNFQRMDDAFYHLGLELVECLGIEAFTGGKPLFAPLSRMQLISGLIERAHIDKELLVVAVPAECVCENDTAQAIQRLREDGFQIAIIGEPSQPDSPAMRYVNYAILRYTDAQFERRYDLLNRLYGKRAIIYNIPDMKAFDTLKKDTNAYFAGTFYGRPITKKTKDSLSPIKVNALRLMNDINQEDFELEDVIKIIERDPYLSVSLLRFLNSTASGLSRKVDSISQAVTILGQNSVRRWASIALSVALGQDRPNEITKLALVRAKFAESIAGSFELGVFQQSLFMAGLFSLLDVMLEKPMEDALNEVPVSKVVKSALLEHEGPLAPVMELIYAYEQADWNKVSILMVRDQIEIEHITQAYLDALVWYSSLLRTIDAEASDNQ